MAAHSDSDFKQLFAFPELACELLRAAVPSPWARHARAGDFTRLNASYVNLDGKQRHDDIVWCVHRPARPNIYMLLEFQSRPEKFMALRMFSYVCLLCEDLLRQRRATHGHFPLVLPVVLYSGRSQWNAATSLADLRPQANPHLEAMQPELKYCVVDRNTASHLIHAVLELNQADDRQTRLPELMSIIDIWLRRQHNPDLSRTVIDWIKRQMGTAFDLVTLPPESSLEEIVMMFEHKFRDYEALLEYQAIERGKEKGMAIGIAQGIEQGIEQGLERGLEQGIEQGLEQGLAQGLARGLERGREEARVLERRRVLSLLIERTGIPVAGHIAFVLMQADPDQLAEWIDHMISDGGLPPELANA